MSDYVTLSQPAFVLHQRPYRETSLILDALTCDFGRISLIAKGVRKAKSKTAGILQPFTALSLSFAGKSDLRTLTDAEPICPPKELSGLALYCGFYVNELVSHFLHKDDPHPEVFHDYQECLSKLQLGAEIEAALRVFELNLMDNIGYGVNLSYDLHNGLPIKADKKYLFHKDIGLVVDTEGPFLGSTLLAIEQSLFDDPNVLSTAKRLMRIVIDQHLQGKPLKSRLVINNIVKRL